MNIAHLCLGCFYIPNMAYQENILPRKHKELGHQVEIITSTYAFDANGNVYDREPGTFVNEDGINVTVLPYADAKYSRALRQYNGVFEALDKLKPDIIFCHGTQFKSILDVIRYKKKNKEVRLIADHHGDYYNAGLMVKNRVVYCRRLLIQKVLWGHYARKFARYGEKIYGVTPMRQKFLQDVYGVPAEKTELLVMGGDENKIKFDQLPALREQMRKDLHLDSDDFVLVTGGKIEKEKNIHLLMSAVAELNQDKLKLIVFGQPNEEMEPIIEKLSQDKHIRYIGWLPADGVYDYFLTADLAVFPGTHSVLWEQACSCGIPIMVKDWEGMHHVDVGGNCVFLKQDKVEEIKQKIEKIFNEPEQYFKMKQIAIEKGIPFFSYKEIAKRAIECNEDQRN